MIGDAIGIDFSKKYPGGVTINMVRGIDEASPLLVFDNGKNRFDNSLSLTEDQFKKVVGLVQTYTANEACKKDKGCETSTLNPHLFTQSQAI
jgi:hypothetical protein